MIKRRQRKRQRELKQDTINGEKVKNKTTYKTCCEIDKAMFTIRKHKQMLSNKKQ